MAAESIGRYGKPEELAGALEVLVEYADMSKHGVFLSIMALNALDYLEEKAAPVKDRIAALPKRRDGVDQRYASYVPRLIQTIGEDLR